jgi:hypothetical protein
MKLRILSAPARGRSSLLAAVLWVLAASSGAAQHHRQYPTPPPPADAEASSQPSQPDLSPKARPNAVQLQQEIEELSSLAQNLQQDIDSVNRGLLPKDTVGKLKRVEKLARHLRREIAP